ncbi:unnamed protein product [Mycena citricolor]|uniref:Uncharacterized protein n=1 Tax=Mycena citricolor TaxID=2018698 RepID=A0AAD2HW19_9AGAR|nr:unnamed protein product [Mycena citricolor]
MISIMTLVGHPVPRKFITCLSGEALSNAHESPVTIILAARADCLAVQIPGRKIICRLLLVKQRYLADPKVMFSPPLDIRISEIGHWRVQKMMKHRWTEGKEIKRVENKVVN